MAKTKNKMGNVAACSPLITGGVGQGSYDEQAKRGFEQYSQTFGKFLTAKEEGNEFSEQEQQKRDRAKKANKIYKRACEDVGLKACFFNNFGDWSEYIDGRMSDAEFHTNAVERARQMVAESN
ncbi:MAG: hypothetical protein WAW37_05250 [Syntrophobacteraceae bacterium]